MELTMTQAQALELARSATFRAFELDDYDTFSGVESAFPVIAEVDEFILVLDGFTLEVINEHGDYQSFDLRG
jgi:hypothetical protein